MDAVTFTVPGAPVGKGRARSVPRKGKGGKTYIAHVTPEKTANFESLVALAGSQAMAGRELLVDGACVRLDVFCPIPKSMSKKDRARVEADALRPTTKPDVDNVVKAVFDGMNGVVWKDDSQVVDARIVKRYSDTPRVVVSVEAFRG